MFVHDLWNGNTIQMKPYKIWMESIWNYCPTAILSPTKTIHRTFSSNKTDILQLSQNQCTVNSSEIFTFTFQLVTSKVTDVNIKNVTHKILVDVHYKNWKHTTAIQYKSRGPTCVVIQNFLRVPTWRLSLNWKQSTLARYRADSTIYLHSVFQWNCRRRWPQLKRRNYLLFRTVQLNDSRSAAHLSLLPELGLSLSSIFKYIQTESNKFRELLCLESMRRLVTDRFIWSLELLLSQSVTHHRSLNF